MLYILCEDSGSGFTFFNEVNRLLLQNRASVIHAGIDENDAGGIGKILDRVNSIHLKRGDTLFLVIDCGDAGATAIINKVKARGVKNGFNTLYTEYICIEEVFLSFSALVEWMGIKYDQTLLDIYKVVYEMVENNESNNIIVTGKNQSKVVMDYEELIRDNKYIQTKTFTTIPQFFASLLHVLTRPKLHTIRPAPDFRMEKGKLGDCWSCNCEEGAFPNSARVKRSTKFCQKCNCVLEPQKTEMTGIIKMIILNDNSILKKLSTNLLSLEKYI